MPKQHALLGRLLPPLPARRLASLLLSLSLLALVFIALVAGAIPASPRPAAYHSTTVSPNAAAPNAAASHAVASHVADAPSQTVLKPLGPLHNPPPRQANDEYSGASWLADRKWLSVPFSNSRTQDDRALLPPLAPRQPIYCYYHAAADKAREEKDAEAALLLTWRRAWWARGFRPLILTSAEAVNHPSYARLEQLEISPVLRHDLNRWLAWHSVGAGVLAHYTVLPTAADDDPTLSSLRRGDFPPLGRWQDLGDALLVGHKDAVGTAIEQALRPAMLAMLQTGMADLLAGHFDVDKTPAPLASYTQRVVDKKYHRVAMDFKRGRAQGLRSLNGLITAHLHISWQNRFPQGIEVLKPHPGRSTTMIGDALKLARQLASCSKSPMPSTCPPHQPRCAPCVATAPMQISTPPRYRNSSHVYSIGIVPHPWTYALLHNLNESFNVSWVRRESARDPWLTAITQALLGAGPSGSRRVMALKEAIAGEYATSRSLWLVAEDGMPPDLSWYFGFAVPEHGIDQGKTKSPVPALRLVPNKPAGRLFSNVPAASKEDLAKEKPLLKRARQVVMQSEATRTTRATRATRMRATLEAWSMADTEAWKFVRAFQARNALMKAMYGDGTSTEEPPR